MGEARGKLEDGRVPVNTSTDEPVNLPWAHWLISRSGRAYAMAGDTAKGKAAYHDFRSEGGRFPVNASTDEPVNLPWAHWLISRSGRAYAMAGDTAKGKAAYHDFR